MNIDFKIELGLRSGLARHCDRLDSQAFGLQSMRYNVLSYVAQTSLQTRPLSARCHYSGERMPSESET